MTRPKVTYKLVRVVPPNGTEREQGPFTSAAMACGAALYVLTDNTPTSRADAFRFAGKLHAAELGSELTHEPTGYRFRIERDDPAKAPERPVSPS
jgi:hypothetical protein